MIKVSKLNKYFNKGRKSEMHVLDDIELEFPDTGLVCILGESGSGKTTLLNTIGGLDTFHSGVLDYNGTQVKKYQPKVIEDIRNDNFGYIFQNYYLLQDYTVAYNVKLALNTFDISEEEKEERVQYVLEKLDISRYKKKLVSQLSGGQQQRVSIARALVKSPKIILADEPTGNLDEENTLRTMSILKNIAKECLVILVSHERRIANFFADRIIEIRDGKITKDYVNANDDAYERMDDGNIYLKDLKEEHLFSEDDAFIRLYENPKKTKDHLPIRLNLAWKHGKLYIQNLTDCDMILAGTEAGCEMLDTHRPNVEMTEVENFDFSLPHLKNHTSARLGFREIWKLAIENIGIMGKKQAFIIGILLLTGVMMTISLANFTNNFFYNERSVLKNDSHYINISLEPEYEMENTEYYRSVRGFFEKYFISGEYSDVFKSGGGKLLLYYDGFNQLNSMEVEFKDMSYVDIKHLPEKNLVYGRMPKDISEIVVDQWLIDRFMDKENPYQTIFSKTEDFLHAKLVNTITSDHLEIVGICNTNEPSIYISQNKALGLTIDGYSIASVSQLQKKYPGKYDDLNLKTGELLMAQTQYDDYDMRKTSSFRMANGREYQIMGNFPDGFGVNYVLSDLDCLTIRNDYIIGTSRFQVYTKNPGKAVKELRKIASDYKQGVSITVINPNQSQMAKFDKSREDSVSSRNLIALAAVIISLFIIYFMVKSNVSARTEELTVYRLIGIEKTSIIQAYLLEMFLITSYTVLPAVLITSGVIRFIGSIPSLELGMIFPWWCVLLLLLVMYLLNLVISILPVRSILSRPPAVLAAK